VPALFGKPQAYARFLSSELTGPVTGPVRVVMSQGFGLARTGRGLSRAPLAGLAIGPGDGLVPRRLPPSPVWRPRPAAGFRRALKPPARQPARATRPFIMR
jgi:hypothetical protein